MNEKELIKLMSEYIAEQDIEFKFCKNRKKCNNECTECVIKYFETKIKMRKRGTNENT